MKRFMSILGTFFRMKAEESWDFTCDTAVPVLASILLATVILGGSSYMVGWGVLGWDGYVKTVYGTEDGSKTVEQAREDLIEEDGVFKARVTAGLFAILMLGVALIIIGTVVYSIYRIIKFLIGNWVDAVAEVDSRRRDIW